MGVVYSKWACTHIINHRSNGMTDISTSLLDSLQLLYLQSSFDVVSVNVHIPSTILSYVHVYIAFSYSYGVLKLLYMNTHMGSYNSAVL